MNTQSMNTGKVALVTGGNQGLGLALVKGLANRLGSDDIVYMASRSVERGVTARDALGKTTARVEVVQLDVTDQASITALAELLAKRHGGLDIVASNAAARITKDRLQSEQVRDFVATNNHGSRALYAALLPLLNVGARYIMVSSAFGQLSYLPPQLRDQFDTDTVSLDDVEIAMDRFVAAMEEGTAKDAGWPDWINVPSKIGQVATARIAARDMAKARPDDGILINAVCPGLVNTDASRPWFDNMDEAQSPDEAAVAVVNLLLTPFEAVGPSGKLMQFGKALPWL